LVEQTSERGVVVAEQVDHVGRRIDDEIGLLQIGGESVEVERAPGTTIYDQFFSCATVGQLKRSDKQRMVRQYRRVNPNDGNQVVGSTNKNIQLEDAACWLADAIAQTEAVDQRAKPRCVDIRGVLDVKVYVAGDKTASEGRGPFKDVSPVNEKLIGDGRFGLRAVDDNQDKRRSTNPNK